MKININRDYRNTPAWTDTFELEGLPCSPDDNDNSLSMPFFQEGHENNSDRSFLDMSHARLKAYVYLYESTGEAGITDNEFYGFYDSKGTPLNFWPIYRGAGLTVLGIEKMFEEVSPLLQEYLDDFIDPGLVGDHIAARLDNPISEKIKEKLWLWGRDSEFKWYCDAPTTGPYKDIYSPDLGDIGYNIMPVSAFHSEMPTADVEGRMKEYQSDGPDAFKQSTIAWAKRHRVWVTGLDLHIAEIKGQVAEEKPVKRSGACQLQM